MVIKRVSNRRAALKGFALAAALFLAAACSGLKPPANSTTLYLIRHAEKDVSDTANKSDPVLTEAGELRAQSYVDYFSDMTFDAVYSSDYIRTRDTAAPVAAAQGVPVTLYDASDLAGFAKGLMVARGNILVVGHSNTTPQLAALLGGVAGSEINELEEHDRLYKLTLHGGKTQSDYWNIDAPEVIAPH